MRERTSLSATPDHKGVPKFDKRAFVTLLQNRAVDEVVKELGSHSSVKLIAPTSAGKTRMTSRIMLEVTNRFREAHGRTPILMSFVHRTFLAAKNKDALGQWAPELTLPASLSTQGEIRPSQNMFMTIQTAASRLDDLPIPDFVFIDETHHLTEKDSEYAKVIDYLLEQNPNLQFVAATATPDRPDDVSLHKAIDNAPEVVIPFRDLEQAGQIHMPQTVPIPTTSINDRPLIHEIKSRIHRQGMTDLHPGGLNKLARNLRSADFHHEVANFWEHHHKGGGTLAFEENIALARLFANEIRSRGYRVETVEHTQGTLRNQQILDDYAAGKLDMIVAVNMISEGLHVPGTKSIIKLVGTTSAIEDPQMNGRTMSVTDDPALANIRPTVMDAGISHLIHGKIEDRAAAIDYQYRLKRNELRAERTTQAGTYLPHRGDHSAWKLVHQKPPIVALVSAEKPIFARMRGTPGNQTFDIIEATPNKFGKYDIAPMRKDGAGIITSVTIDQLEHIERESILPLKRVYVQREMAMDPTGKFATPAERRTHDLGEYLDRVIAMTNALPRSPTLGRELEPAQSQPQSASPDRDKPIAISHHPHDALRAPSPSTRRDGSRSM